MGDGERYGVPYLLVVNDIAVVKWRDVILLFLITNFGHDC